MDDSLVEGISELAASLNQLHKQMADEYAPICRYYYALNPAATADYVFAYRDMWDSDGESLKAER